MKEAATGVGGDDDVRAHVQVVAAALDVLPQVEVLACVGQEACQGTSLCGGKQLEISDACEKGSDDDDDELRRRIQATEIRCYRKILHISYKDHVTNKEVRTKIQQATGPHQDLLRIVKRHKLQWYGHVSVSYTHLTLPTKLSV